jgi:hypothetical protein
MVKAYKDPAWQILQHGSKGMTCSTNLSFRSFGVKHLIKL